MHAIIMNRDESVVAFKEGSWRGVGAVTRLMRAWACGTGVVIPAVGECALSLIPLDTDRDGH